MLDFILQPQVLSVLALIVVALIGWRGRNYLNHFRLVFQVWHFVEKLGILNNLKGSQKLALAMDTFRDKFYDKFGKVPSPSDEGWAVKILTWLCKLEDKDTVEDFLPESEVLEAVQTKK